MRLTFCAACGVTDDLQHHHLVTRSKGDSDDERNLITLCDPCHAKLRERRSDGPTATDRLNEAAGIAGEAVGRLRAVWRHGRPQRGGGGS
jgi:HNH endonuclease